jgi:hypothetical protein
MLRTLYRLCSVSCCSVLLRKDIGYLIPRQVLMVSECVQTYLCEFVVRKNGPNNPSLLVAHHTPTLSYHIMESHGLTWKTVLFWEFTYPQKWKQVALLNSMCGVYFFIVHCSKGPAHKIRSLCTVCVVKFVSHSCLTWMQMQKFCCILCWWCRHAHFLCRWSKFFLEMSVIWHWSGVVSAHHRSSACVMEPATQNISL